MLSSQSVSAERHHQGTRQLLFMKETDTGNLHIERNTLVRP